jgi:GGDEF domain-containing protein
MALDEKRLRHKLEQSNALLREQKILFDEDSVYSRDYFFKLLQQAITAAQPGLVLSLMALEVEIRGENVVPTPEQAALLRKRVIETLQDCCRGTDTIGEFHQEKLAVFMPATPIQGAQIVANRVKQALEQSPLAGMPLVAHVGLADLSTCKTFDTLIRQAATTLHTARQSSLL